VANNLFAVKMFVLRVLLRATHGKLFVESKPGFAVSIGLTANPRFPVVKLL
jgi:hypothetical protein